MRVAFYSNGGSGARYHIVITLLMQMQTTALTATGIESRTEDLGTWVVVGCSQQREMVLSAQLMAVRIWVFVMKEWERPVT